jgi:hypothetical protein
MAGFLSQVLACAAVRPELLERLATRFPELGGDMEVRGMLKTHKGCWIVLVSR